MFLQHSHKVQGKTFLENFLLLDMKSTSIFVGHLLSAVPIRPMCPGVLSFKSAPCISLAPWYVSDLVCVPTV